MSSLYDPVVGEMFRGWLEVLVEQRVSPLHYPYEVYRRVKITTSNFRNITEMFSMPHPWDEMIDLLFEYEEHIAALIRDHEDYYLGLYFEEVSRNGYVENMKGYDDNILSIVTGPFFLDSLN